MRNFQRALPRYSNGRLTKGFGQRVSRTQYQYTLEDPNVNELNFWTNRFVARLQHLPQLEDVATDQQTGGMAVTLAIDRMTASRLGIAPATIDNTLYDSFGQRQINTMYTQTNQYHVILEAAINAARTYLPANLPANPSYRKTNPADAPIMILGLTSGKYPPSKLYDEASTVMEQKLSQLQGVGQVVVGGTSLPSVRVDVNPTQLNSYGLSLASIQSALVNRSVGFGNDLRRRIAPCHRKSIHRHLQWRSRRLPPDRPQRFSTGGRRPGRSSHPLPANRAAARRGGFRQGRTRT